VSIDTLLTKGIEVISLKENRKINVSILSADAVSGGQTATMSTRERERENDKLCRVARDVTVIPWQASGDQLRDTGLILMHVVLFMQQHHLHRNAEDLNGFQFPLAINII